MNKNTFLSLLCATVFFLSLILGRSENYRFSDIGLVVSLSTIVLALYTLYYRFKKTKT